MPPSWPKSKTHSFHQFESINRRLHYRITKRGNQTNEKGKAPGPDGLRPDLTKLLAEENNGYVLGVVNHHWRMQTFPTHFEQANVVTVYKKETQQLSPVIGPFRFCKLSTKFMLHSYETGLLLRLTQLLHLDNLASELQGAPSNQHLWPEEANNTQSRTTQILSLFC